MKLSIVAPCYNESGTVIDFYNMVKNFLEDKKIKYELIMIDDGSTDDTYKKLEQLNKEDKNVKVIAFSRNFGKEAAMYAGLEYASGNYIAIMDTDMQQRIETLYMMYNKLLENEEFDIVCAYRENRGDESSFKRTLTSLFYRLNNSLTYIRLLPGASDFRIFKSEVKDALLSMKESNRFLKGMFSWVGFNTIYVPYNPSKREHGISKWSIFKLIKYSIGGIISFSTKPLKFVALSSLITFIVGTLNFLLLGSLSFKTVIMMLSLIILNIGIISLYVIRIYSNSLKRPIYIAKKKIGLDKKTTK